MKFILFVEGYTEDKALTEFLGRWLNERLTSRVGIKTVRFEGWQQLVKDSNDKAKRYLNDPSAEPDIIAVVALLDFYGPTFYPSNKSTTAERYEWAKAHLEKQVGHPKFRQYFAVHEVEAWLLSDPSIFPSNVAKALQSKSSFPEKINHHEPPAKLLDSIYLSQLKRKYRKPVDGKKLFMKLNPQTAYEKCPYLKSMLDEMLQLAQNSAP